MIEKVKEWLAAEEKGYHTGVDLAEAHGLNPRLVIQLRRGQTSVKMEMLIYELSKIAGVEYVPTPGAEVNHRQVVSEATEGQGGDILRGLLQQRAGMYAERAQISDTLANLEGEELKAATLKVTEIDDQIIALGTQIRHVELHGSLPEEQDLKEDLEFFKGRRKTLGEKRSRLRKQQEKTPNNLERKAEIEKLDAEIEELDLKIKAFTQPQ